MQLPDISGARRQYYINKRIEQLNRSLELGQKSNNDLTQRLSRKKHLDYQQVRLLLQFMQDQRSRSTLKKNENS